MQFRELTERYQLQKIVKSSRFGTIFRAADAKTGGTAAIKLVMVPSPPRLMAGAPAFEKLAGVLAGLNHPGLPRVSDHGFTTDGAAFLALELLEGRTLDTVAGAPSKQVLNWIGQALVALEALANQGLAHLNVSPDNLFLAATPQGERIKLLGLGTGMFRPAGAEAASAGAPENARYIAPEIVANVPVDARADLFSLALVACTALGGTVGFGDTPVVQLPLAVSFELENDEVLRQTLERALRRNPAERPGFRDFREALKAAIGVPAAAPAAVPPQAQQPVAVAPPAPAMPVMPPPVQAAPQPAAPPPPPLLSAAAPEPEPQDGEMLSAVDDEVLNALLSVPPPPPRPAAPEEPEPGGAAKVVPFLNKKASPTPTPAPSRAPARATVPPLRRPAVLGTIAFVVLVLVGAAVWFLRRPEPQTVQAPAAPLNLPKIPTQPPTAKLEEARMLLAMGEDVKARRVLRSIPWGEQGLLPADGCRQLAALEENLALAALERLPSDLANGLRSGDLEVLESAAEVGVGREAGFTPQVRADYDRARQAVGAYAEARAAAARNEPLQVLERFAALSALLPKASDPEDLRGKAAAAIEGQAEALLKDAHYADAVAKLEPLARTWPDRPGLQDRMERYRKYDQSEKEQEAILASLPAIERYKKPWDGLQKIKDVEPTPHLAPRFAEARARLEDMLARLDRQPPTLKMRDGFFLEYARGTVAELSFLVKDDYEVKDVKLMARPEKGKYRNLPLEANRNGTYTVEIQPDFHQNGKVELYVVATDLSGHEAYLGTAEKPLELYRKQGFGRLIR